MMKVESKFKNKKTFRKITFTWHWNCYQKKMIGFSPLKFGSKFLTEKLHYWSVKHIEWPPASLDCNLLDYHFLDKWKSKLMGIGYIKPLQTKKNWGKKIKKIWAEVSKSKDLKEIWRALNQFIRRLTASQEKDGQCIEMLFG